MIEGEKRMLSNEFKNSINSISDGYEREFKKLKQQVSVIEPAIFKIQKDIHLDLQDTIEEVQKQKKECNELIKSLRSASRTLKAFMKDYDKEKITIILKILRLLQNDKMEETND